MRVVKLVLVKKNSEWRAGPFLLNRSCVETEPFNFEAIDPLLQRATRKAQSVFGHIKIVDLKDTEPTWILPVIEEPEVEELIPVVEIKEEPKIDPIKPTEVDKSTALMIFNNKTITKIKASVSKLPKTIENKRVILSMIKMEEDSAKPRKTLLSFLNDAFLAIPEGE